MTEKELINGFLSKTLNMDDAGVASLYNEDGSEIKPEAMDILLKADVERVQKLKPDTKKLIDDGYKKAQSEIMPKLEKEFKERTGFNSDKKGVELFIEYASTKTESNEITEDAIKRHPVYIGAIEKIVKEKDDAIKAAQNELTEFQTGIKKKETFSSISDKATKIFNELKPILSKDPVKAKNQMDDFVNKLKEYEYELQEDRVVVLTKDGKLLEDPHGNRVPFEKIVKETADRYYDFHVAENRQTPSNAQQPQTQTKPNVIIPKTEKEYIDKISDPLVPLEERVMIKEGWAKQKDLVNT